MKKLWFMLSLLPALSAAEPAATAPREWYFQALLDGKPIGHHRFTLTRNGDQQILESQAQFEVKFLFFKAYDYYHHATERWQGDCLRGISSTTDDNGDHFRVYGVTKQDELVVETQKDRTRLPGCVMSFAYWNPEILKQDHLLDPQTGEYMKVQVSFEGQDSVATEQGTLPAERWRLLTNDQRITLWYGAEDKRWLKLESVTPDGYTLRYDLQTPSALGVSRR